MSKETFVGSSSLSVSVPETQFNHEEEVQLGNLILDEELEAELDSAIQDRFSLESRHPFEWSDNGFEADLSNFVFN